MTDNKHAEAVEVVARAICRDLLSDFSPEMMGGIEPEVALAKRWPEFRSTAVAAIAALNTRPDVEAMREACARVAEDRMPAIQCMSVEPVVSACQDIATAIRSIPVPTSGEGGGNG
jgi:hypothetical protein